MLNVCRPMRYFPGAHRDWMLALCMALQWGMWKQQALSMREDKTVTNYMRDWCRRAAII